MHRYFKTLPKVASYHQNVIIRYKKNLRAVFELQAPKAAIKGFFSCSYCCYNNVFANDWVGF